MSFLKFNRDRLKLKPLCCRSHDLSVSSVRECVGKGLGFNSKLHAVAKQIIRARKSRSSVILMIGAHVIRSGVQKYIIDLMEKGYISCIAMNGGGMIHDFEFSLIGATTENVAKYINEGQFGLWKETGQLNDIINNAYRRHRGIGMGEAVGKYIQETKLPYRSISILASACRLHIPATVHVGIGYDIIHEHPNCNAAATGALSYNDFLTYAAVIEGIENGVVMNFGSAVMAPEIFLKALSMARNVAWQKNKSITHFTALVCDLMTLPDDIKRELNKAKAHYYFRPLKTMLIRTVSGGGSSFYVRAAHAKSLPMLWSSIKSLEADQWGK